MLAFFLAIGLALPAESDPEPDSAPQEAADADASVTTTEPTTSEETTTGAAPPQPPLLVAKVTDGDTIDLNNGDTIRLVQIDAPERRGECYGRKSGTVLRRLLPPGTKVKIVRDPKLDNIDRYGRLLRYVFKAKKNVNLVLVQKGAASVWFFEGDRGRYARKLTRAAEQARAQKRGAWGACEASYDFLSAWSVERKPPPPAPTSQPANCHPSYKGECLDPSASDYDCASGSGNGPEYVYGSVRVVGYDEYGLDADGDGYGCES